MTPRSDAAADRVLVLTPTGRDGPMVSERLEAAGYACEVCPDVASLLAGLAGASVAVVAQEALDKAGADALLAALDAQEPWSDVPILLLTFAPTRRAPHAHAAVALFERANVMLLQRPLRPQLLVGAVRSAVRARRRQHQMRDLHRALERAVQLSEMFVSILGHDLRTPLTAIKLSAQLIHRLAPDEQVRRPAGRLLSATDRMTRMIDQLLDFARVRQGRGIRLQAVATDVGEVTRQVLQELVDANPEARIEPSYAGNLAGTFDPDRLAQVVSNLAGNAVRHGTPGKPVTVESDGTEGGVVRLRVSNHGAIPSEAISALFEPFKHPAQTRSAEEGLGLGLYIAREIVRAHGGDIGVRVTQAGVTIFEASIPREARPVESAVLSPA